MWENIFEPFLQSLINISPTVFWAILVLFIGWFVSKWIGQIAAAFLSKIRLNQVLKRMGLEEVLTKIDTHLNAPKFFGEIVR